MKKIINSILFSVVVCGLVSCSNGDYQASPDNNGNGAINPITPLTDKDFTWGGDKPLSADINGSHWVADNVYFYLDASGSNRIVATKTNSPYVLNFSLRDVWSGNLYSMEWEDFTRFAVFTDSSNLSDGGYYSYLSNSGGFKMVTNDTSSLEGQFYFKGVSVTGKVVNIVNGYFKFDKW